MLQLVCLKSFGDFVIALRSLQRVAGYAQSEQTVLLAGSHLRALANAMGSSTKLQFVGEGMDMQVPALYDVRRLGVSAAVRSLLALRRQLGPGSGAHVRLFDRVGWRERLLAGRSRALGLPAGPNIYIAYERGLEHAGLRLTPLATPSPRAGRRALIVPASRIADKALPREVIASTHAQLQEMGFDAHVLVLAGESVDLPGGAPVRHEPRNFSSLIEAIRSADLVVSADSLPAHLSEYFSVPTFVVTPQPNEYWMPHYAFATRGWCIFKELARLRPWVLGHAAQG